MNASEDRRVVTVVALAAMLTAAIFVFVIPGTDIGGVKPGALALILGTMAACARLFPLQIAFRRRMVIDTAPLFAAALLLPPALAGAAAFAGIGVAELICLARGNGARRQVVFNACQAALGVIAGAAAFDAVAQGATISADGATVTAAAGAALVMLAANDLLVFFVVWAQLGLRLDRMARDFVRGRGDLAYDAALYGLGLLTALVGAGSPWLVPLFAVPVPTVYQAMRNQIALRKQTREAVMALADAVDDRDPYTFGHCRRVAEFAAELCAHMRYSPDLTDEIVLAARVHDVGKIGIRDAVLLKPSRLTPEEFDHIKQHPDIGARLTARFPDFSRGTRYIRHHHERWDGTGYPSGLRANDIPLGARIIAVADTYDAMTSTRPYRAGLSDEAAHTEMARVAGEQLDPEIVAAWLDLRGWSAAIEPVALPLRLAA